MKKLPASRKFEEGLILFARYAFAPNYFKYCGPDKNKDIAEALAGNFDQKEFRQILNHFDAAVPYLNLIAKSNHIVDPFNAKVVEAYWLGNNLLYNVPAEAVYSHLVSSVKPRIKKGWNDIEKEIGLGAKPHHSFHVFDIYRTAGFTRDGSKRVAVVDLINNCMIGWGNISKITNHKSQITNYQEGELLVKSQRIDTKNNKFILVPEEKTVKNIGADLEQGDLVSLHWGFICDKISVRQAKNLEYWTKYHLKITNQFI